MSYDNNDDLAGSGKDKLSHTHFSPRRERRAFRDGCLLNRAIPLHQPHTHTNRFILFFPFFGGVWENPRRGSTVTSILYVLFFPPFSQKVISFFSRHYSEMAAQIRPNSFFSSLQFMARFTPFTKK
jgi:hypothetical protein